MKTKQSNNSAIMPDAVKIANQRALQPFNLEWENDTVFKKRELNYKTKAAFQKDLDAGKISKYTTVFIKDTKEIYKNGQYYGSINETVGKVDSNSDGTGEIFNDYENNKATGVFSHAEGYKNNVIGGASHAEGRECVAQGDSTHSEGYLSTAIGYGSHAEGGGSVSIYLSGDAGATQYKIAKDLGVYSTYSTQSDLYEHINFSGFHIVDTYNNFSLIEIISSSYDNLNDEITITLKKTLSQDSPISNKRYGLSRNIACGEYSHIEGMSNYTSIGAKQGHVEGVMNTLINDGGHIEGALNIGKSEQCHVEGISNIANNECEHAQGNYNKSNTGDTDDKKTLHSIGIGAKGARKNAQEVMRNGDHYIIGIGGYDGTNPSVSKTLQEAIKEFVSEAPTDGNVYGRKDKQWEKMIKQKVVTESEYSALGSTVNTDGILYFVTPD